MSLELCILASGSAGNAAILRSKAGVLLIDAGIGPRTLAKRLDGTGVRPTDIAALCLTHLDRRPLFAPLGFDPPPPEHPDLLSRQQGRCPRPLLPPISCRSYDHSTTTAFSPIDGLTCDPIHFAHDRLGSHGFVVDGFGYRIGYATDLGHVPSLLL